MIGHDNPNLDIYMREIGEVPLLTRDEEVELSLRVRKGDEEARQKMMKANLRLVVKIAYDYAHLGLPLLDLISEGNIGLAKAVDRYEPDRGAKFSTYATCWIKQAIRRALTKQKRTVRLPAHVIDRLSKMRRAKQELTNTLRREPTDEEVAVHLDMNLHDFRKLQNCDQRITSLDAPVGAEDDSRHLIEVMADDRVRAPFDEVIDSELRESVMQLIERLRPREQEILARRYGLNGKKKETLDSTGRRFGLTRERIRQIQLAATIKLGKMFEDEAFPGGQPAAGSGQTSTVTRAGY